MICTAKLLTGFYLRRTWRVVHRLVISLEELKSDYVQYNFTQNIQKYRATSDERNRSYDKKLEVESNQIELKI